MGIPKGSLRHLGILHKIILWCYKVPWKIILQPDSMILILRKLMKILTEPELKSIGMDFKSLGEGLRLETFL